MISLFIVMTPDSRTSAELKIQLPVFQQKNICGVSTDIHDEDTWRTNYQAALRNNRRICLRENHNFINYYTIRFFLIDKVNGTVFFEITGKLILQHSVVLWGSPTAN